VNKHFAALTAGRLG